MGLGRISAKALSRGRLFGDKMLSKGATKWGIIGGGAAAFALSRQSNNGFIRGAGDIAGLGAAGLGGYWAAKRWGGLKGFSGANGPWKKGGISSAEKAVTGAYKPAMRTANAVDEAAIHRATGVNVGNTIYHGGAQKQLPDLRSDRAARRGRFAV